jgi:cysteinyl-tRNA synthetase
MSAPLPITLYDTYLKRTTNLDPASTVYPNTLSLYSCGPTVYGYQSIGNMRAVWLPDTLSLTAQLAGWKVNWVLNITDVGHLVGDSDVGEDKIEKAAKANKQTVEQIVTHYTDDYQAQCKALNFALPTGFYNPKATDYIEEQMLLTAQLLKDKLCYVSDDGIYFDYTNFKSKFGGKATGALVEILERDLKSQGDRAFSDRKIESSAKHPFDFAVWKFVDAKALQQWKFADYPHVMELLSITNTDLTKIQDLPGCPGWHSECVCMIVGTLGHVGQTRDTLSSEYYTQFTSKPAIIDVHTGGEDHIDIHHKNEILQSTALGINLSKTWIHNKFVMVDGQKMSKSLGNIFQVVGDSTKTGFVSLAEKEIDPLSYRLMLMEHHYTEQLNFTWDKLNASRTRLNNLRKLGSAITSFAKVHDITMDPKVTLASHPILTELLDNLNTPKALELFSALLTKTVDMLVTKSQLSAHDYALCVLWDTEFFKLNILATELYTSHQKTLTDRTNAKFEKRYEDSDKLRDSLTDLGLRVDDYTWGSGVRTLA